MSIVSVEFAVFVGVALAAYAWLPARWQIGWLVVVSLAFQATFSWRLALVATAATASKY